MAHQPGGRPPKAVGMRPPEGSSSSSSVQLRRRGTAPGLRSITRGQGSAGNRRDSGDTTTSPVANGSVGGQQHMPPDPLPTAPAPATAQPGPSAAEDIIRLLESTDLSEEDTEALLHDAYALNRLLKSELASQEVKADIRRTAAANDQSRFQPLIGHQNSGSRLPPLMQGATPAKRATVIRGGKEGGTSHNNKSPAGARMAEMRSLYGPSPSTPAAAFGGRASSKQGSTVSRKTISRARTMPVPDWVE